MWTKSNSTWRVALLCNIRKIFTDSLWESMILVMSDDGKNVRGDDVLDAGEVTGRAHVQSGTGRCGDASRWVKLGFVAVVILAAAMIYLKQRGGPAMTDEWGTDLSAGLSRAQASGCRAIVFFVSDPMGEPDRWVIDNVLTMGENRKIISEGKYVCIRVAVPSLSTGDVTRRYNVTKLPTLLLLDSSGAELNRREVKLGQVELRNGFLDCAVIQRSSADLGK